MYQDPNDKLGCLSIILITIAFILLGIAWWYNWGFFELFI